jgi:hypothetical protein
VPSPELHIPPNLDREGIEHYRQKVERLLNRLTLEAETWAESGTRRQGQQPLVRAPAPLRSHRIAPPPVAPEEQHRLHVFDDSSDGPQLSRAG